MTKNLPATADYQVVTYKSRSGDQITLTADVVKSFLVTGRKEYVTPQELVYFLGICRARGLNPFTKDVYLIKYTENEPAAIITSIDFYRSRARAQADCKGWEKGIIAQKKDGSLRYSKGLLLADEELVGAWFKAQPSGWDLPFELEINLSGFIKKTREGNVTKFWSKENQPMMLMKCVESQALRTLWPDEFRGILGAEEIGELSEALTVGELLPEPKGGAAPPAEKPDTSVFDGLVEEKLKESTAEEYKARAEHLGLFLKETAERMTTKKNPVSTEMLMVSGGSHFEPYTDTKGNAQVGFWKKFLDWEAMADKPWNQEPAPEVSAEAQAPGSEPQKEPASTGAETFEQRAHRVWGLAVKKYGKLVDIKANLKIAGTKDLTEENIDGIEQAVTS